MEESNEELNVVPELYFLIAKFLSGGPLKETAKTLLKELESVEVLPRRLDWEGGDHPQSYQELDSQYSDVSWTRLASVCERALKLARLAPSTATSLPALLPSNQSEQALRLTARLSLLSDSLVRPKPKYSVYKQDHTLVRRLISREQGTSAAWVAGGRGGQAVFPARQLSGLQLQRRTLGHLSAVYCLVFDCSGRYVITGADDLLVKVWSATEGRLLGTLRGAGAEITDACVSSDAALLAVGSVERLVRVWCLRTGAERAVLHAHAGTITSVHWAPPARTDVRWLASTSTDGSVAFWTCTPDGQFLSRPVQYVERMRPGACHMICSAWSAGGAFLAAGSADLHVRVYRLDLQQQAPRRVLEVAVHEDAVDSIAWAHSGLRFVSGSKDGTAALWTLHATQWRHHLLRCNTTNTTTTTEPRRLKVTMVCWDCSDAYVITAVSDNTVRVWCSRTCQQVRVLSGHRDEAYVLEAHPFLPGVILSAGHDGQLFVWHARDGEVLAHFHNQIEGQGDGAIFDAKWGSGATVAASDSHGHLLLLGLGQGHRLLSLLPTELFFHTDYRPLVRDALGSALDEQTELPPHLMAPPFLVDVEGLPHAPALQRLVPGRENLLPSQLVPSAADGARSRLDLMIEALAAERTPPGSPHSDSSLPARGGGPWRGQGVRHTGGSWQAGEPCAPAERPLVQSLPAAAAAQLEAASAELNALEQSWYRREMRRRPVMITTAIDGGPRRKPGRRPVASARAVRVQPQPARASPEPEESVTSDTSDSSVRLSGSDRSDRSERSDRSRAERRDRAATARVRTAPRARPRARRDRVERDRSTDSESSISYSDTKTVESSSSSQYSDWEAGAALAPPARARRRPVPTARYSPSVTPSKRPPGGGASAPRAAPGPPRDLPEAYRPGEWLCAVSPRKAPYHPQMGDHCLYFRLGHQRYFEAVAEKDLYKVNVRDKPWDRTHIYECEQVKVVGIKYVIKPPRVVCLRLAATTESTRVRTFTVRYHDMADVIDFLVLQQQYDAATCRHWGQGDRFRCMIDDSWWTGIVLERTGTAVGTGTGTSPGPGPVGTAEAAAWAAQAAAHFLSLRVRWDNGEVERLSPWDLEPLDPERLPSSPSASVPVLPHELEAVLYRASPAEWPPRGDRAAACRAIAHHIGAVMSLSAAEPFVAPVDLQQYPSYAMLVPYPIDLATIRARFDNLFYRRTAAAQFDVRYLASNAEQFNELHSPIVRQARLVTDLLLCIISNWRDVDVVGKYHELAASYRSSDDEPLASSATISRGGGGVSRRRGSTLWRTVCARALRQLVTSPDAEPFQRPVAVDQAPDYHVVVSSPMDLGTVQQRLDAGHYSSARQFAADVRLVFTNSRLYNTNKRSRIYSMTVRLSSLFESVWSRVEPSPSPSPSPSPRPEPSPSPGASRAARRTRRAARQARRAVRHAAATISAPAEVPSGSSDSETLAATSRRVHAHSDDYTPAPGRSHRKGKGVGKKSKSSSNSAEPAPSTSRQTHETYIPPSNGLPSESEPDLDVEQHLEIETGGGMEPGGGEGGGGGSDESSEYCDISVVEQELVEEEVQLEYSDGQQSMVSRSHKRPRASHSSDSDARARRRRRRRAKRRRRHGTPPLPTKRTRERFTEGSSSSHSSGSEASPCSARHYESDRSYRPRYSTDDDKPLHLYRQRHQGGGDDDQAGPSSRRHNGHARGARVRLRARSPRRYNEDSEEDSVAAISKRLPPSHPAARHPRPLQMESRGHASHSRHNDDHNYFNGHNHNHGHNHGHSHGHSAGPHASTTNNNTTNGSRESESTAPVSISSRGRIRKLTAKARGLLRE